MPKISQREKEILRRISLGYTSKEIAAHLYLSEHTVIAHKKNLFSKMEVCNAPALVRKGFETGILVATA